MSTTQLKFDMKKGGLEIKSTAFLKNLEGNIYGISGNIKSGLLRDGIPCEFKDVIITSIEYEDANNNTIICNEDWKIDEDRWDNKQMLLSVHSRCSRSVVSHKDFTAWYNEFDDEPAIENPIDISFMFDYKTGDYSISSLSSTKSIHITKVHFKSTVKPGKNKNKHHHVSNCIIFHKRTISSSENVCRSDYIFEGNLIESVASTIKTLEPIKNFMIDSKSLAITAVDYKDAKGVNHHIKTEWKLKVENDSEKYDGKTRIYKSTVSAVCDNGTHPNTLIMIDLMISIDYHTGDATILAVPINFKTIDIIGVKLEYSLKLPKCMEW